MPAARLVAVPVAGGDAGLSAALLAAGLPVNDLAEPGRLFWRFAAEDGAGGSCVGYGGLEPLGAHALLRSLVALPEARGQGHGRDMAGQLLALAAEGGATRAWLLTDTAAAFFESLGFVRAERRDAPATVLATRQASSICGTAPLLTRALGGPHSVHAG